MKCTNCSAEIVQNSKFCPECGTKLNSSEVVPLEVSKNQLLEIIQEKDFDAICNILDKNLQDFINITLSNTYLGKLNIVLSQDIFSIRNIDDDMLNMMRLKDGIIGHIKECAKFNFDFYNNFIACSNNGDNRPFFISKEYREKFLNAFILSNSQLLKEIEYDLPILISHLQQIKNLIKANESRKSQTKKKTGMMLGLAGLATLATGGLAAPLMAAAGLGSSVFMDRNSIGEMENKISEDLEQCKSKFTNIMAHYNQILQTVYLNQKNNLTKELKKALAITFNKIVSQKQSDVPRLKKYILFIEHMLLKNIEITNYCINETSSNNSNIEKALSEVKNQSLLECLSDEQKQKLFNELASRIDPLHTYLLDSAWWLFKFYQKPDLELTKIESIDKIFDKYQLTDNFETLFLMCNSSFYCKGSNNDFNNNKIVELGKKFNGFSTDNVLIYYDSTFFGKGDEGFALSDTKLYASGAGNNSEIALEQITNITLENGKISFFTEKKLIWSQDVASIEKKYHQYLLTCLKKFIATKSNKNKPSRDLNMFIQALRTAILENKITKAQGSAIYNKIKQNKWTPDQAFQVLKKMQNIPLN